MSPSCETSGDSAGFGHVAIVLAETWRASLGAKLRLSVEISAAARLAGAVPFQDQFFVYKPWQFTGTR
jgi:hypothetical protein